MTLHMEGSSGSATHGKHSRKETLIAVGTILLVILAALQLRKSSTSNTTSSSLPAAAFTPSDYTGSIAGTGGSTGGTQDTSAFQSFSDQITQLLQGVTDQAQENQAIVQSQLSGLSQQTDELAAEKASLATLVASLSDKVTNLQNVNDILSHPISVDPAPIANPNIPSTGKPSTSYQATQTVTIGKGQNWNDVSKATGLSLDQLRTLNGPLKALGPGTVTVRTQ